MHAHRTPLSLSLLLLASLLAGARAQEPQPQKPPERLDPLVGCTTACHQQLVKDDFVHKPAQDGKCVDCHKQAEPTAHAFAAIDDIGESCKACHKLEVAAVVHEPFTSMDCTTCHDPHHGKTKALLVSKDTPTLCAVCHKAVVESLDKKFVHGPVADGDCGMCHKAHSAPEAKLLAVEPLELCGKCHQDLASRIEEADCVHAPVAIDCLPCHDVHGSDREHLVKADQPGLCLGCHKPIAEALAAAKTPHGALATQKQCLACHRPHESKHKSLLEKPGKDGCIECHDKPVERAGGGAKVAAVGAQIAAAKFLHGPIRDGECAPCHQPHASAHAPLLQKANPKHFYAPFAEASYELCFSCHERKVFETDKTTELTGFRAGDRNLHFVHVNDAQKGRSCRACHEIHAGDQAKLMAASVPFGSWQLPIRWQQTPTGGSCASGCHKVRTYDRGGAAGQPVDPPKK